ncbi:hypothetical protein [Streptomyces rochei]|uniref:hypothetical protein n=1 Tax=Streptomyces rochei TaxID=1928 RepID=UPI003629C92D
MPETTNPNANEQLRDEMLAAVRKLTGYAAAASPQVGAPALRDLAEAYSILTAPPLEPFPLHQG